MRARRHRTFRMANVLLAGMIALIGLWAGLWATSATAAPFACTGDVYQVQSGQLRVFDPISSSYVNVGTPSSSYNGTGFNVLDNFVYGSQGNNVIRIHGDGTVDTLYNVGFSSNAGDVDRSNTLWLRRNASQYSAVNLGTGAVTTVNFSGPTNNAADVVYISNTGTNYLLAISGGQVGILNLDTATSTTKSVPGLPASGGHGATWIDSTNRIFTFNNTTGQIFEVFGVFSPAPYATLAAQGTASNNNDGFSCSTQPFPNLPPIAIDDAFTTPLNTAVSGNVLAANPTTADSEPEGQTLTVGTTPVTAPTNGAVVIQPNGNFTYTPNLNFIGTDNFRYRIADPSGLIASATVTITVTGTIGFTATKTQTGGANPVALAGDVVDYTITLNNFGEIPLTSVTVADTLPDGTSATLPAPVESGATNPATAVIGQLDVGETWTYTLSYTVKPADLNPGTDLVNAISVTTDQTAAPVTATAATPMVAPPRLALVKTASLDLGVDGVLKAGDIITYTYTVYNPGGVPVHDVTVSELPGSFSGTGALPSLTHVSGGSDLDGDGDAPDLAIGGGTIVFTSTYVVTQADINAGSITNQATAGGTPPARPAISDLSDESGTGPSDNDPTVLPLPPAPALSITKVADDATLRGVNDVITYTYTVTNTGNVPISGVAIADTHNASGLPPLPSNETLVNDAAPLGDSTDAAVNASWDTLAPGDTIRFTGTYTVTQSDVDTLQ